MCSKYPVCTFVPLLKLWMEAGRLESYPKRLALRTALYVKNNTASWYVY